MFGGLFAKKPPTLEQQLRDLQACGVRLLPETTVDPLLADWSREQFEKDPYALAVTALGGDEPLRSENLWHFDVECIEDHFAYLLIAERFRDLAGGDLPLVDIEDYVDVQEGEAWVAFKLDGVAHRWVCEVDADWVDPKIMSRFAELLAARKTEKRFTCLDTGGQDCIIGCFTDDQRKRLRKVTGLDWARLE